MMAAAPRPMLVAAATMHMAAAIAAAAAATIAASATAPSTTGREDISFDYGWRFKHGGRYPTFNPSAFAPAANASAAEAAAAFPDAAWEAVDVPHDMLIGGTFGPQGDGLEMAHLPRGDGWYRTGSNR
jgi:hypothetical protein